MDKGTCTELECEMGNSFCEGETRRGAFLLAFLVVQ